MDTTKRKALEAAGWKFGDAADFLAMSDEERAALDARVERMLQSRSAGTPRDSANSDGGPWNGQHGEFE